MLDTVAHDGRQLVGYGGPTVRVIAWAGLFLCPLPTCPVAPTRTIVEEDPPDQRPILRRTHGQPRPYASAPERRRPGRCRTRDRWVVGVRRCPPGRRLRRP